MVKLSGWKRLGIVVSVLWGVGAYIHTVNAKSDSDMRFAGAITDSCLERNGGQEIGDNECLKRGEQYVIRMLPFDREEAAFVALAPIPLGWGFVYLVLFVVRWVKRGFSEARNSN